MPVLPPGAAGSAPGTASTAQDIINSALRLIGVLPSGEQPSTAETNDALVILNEMLDSWNAERLAIFTIQRQTFALTATKQAYTVGATGDFNIARPPRIDRVGIINLNNPAQPLELPMEMVTDAGWQAIPVKNIQSTLPQRVWDDGGFPLRTLSYWPIPSIVTNTVLYSWASLTQFTDLITQNSYPPGYLKALRYNLAVDLAPEFGRQLVPEVAIQAVQSMAVVKSYNTAGAQPEMSCDPALTRGRGGQWNWLTDQPAGRG